MPLEHNIKREKNRIERLKKEKEEYNLRIANVIASCEKRILNYKGLLANNGKKEGSSNSTY